MMQSGTVVKIKLDDPIKWGSGYLIGFVTEAEERKIFGIWTMGIKVFVPFFSISVNCRWTEKSGWKMGETPVQIEEDKLEARCFTCSGNLVSKFGKPYCPNCKF